jgi:hypothetical protein
MDITDEEYRELLVALAVKHLRADALLGNVDRLRSELNRLIWISKLNEAVRGIPPQQQFHEPELLAPLVQQLLESPVPTVISVMEEVGMMDALDEAPELVFGNLRRSAIPEEDIQLLRAAGVQHPEAEITITISHSREFLARQYPNESPSQVARQGVDTLQQSASELRMQQLPSPARKRKLFNGIGKILGGAVMGAGNVLLACGTFIAPNPATAYTALGSAAVGIGSIFQGIGDIRGE